MGGMGDRMPKERKASASARGYGHRWRVARSSYLASHPLCVECERIGQTAAATVVDHITPHRGDQALFWRRDNWQALCASCHSRHKQRIERSGTVIGCDVDGIPLDPRHSWAKGEGGSNL